MNLLLMEDCWENVSTLLVWLFLGDTQI